MGCIALLLSLGDAFDGFRNKMSPEEVMFSKEEFTDEKIAQWKMLDDEII